MAPIGSFKKPPFRALKSAPKFIGFSPHHRANGNLSPRANGNRRHPEMPMTHLCHPNWSLYVPSQYIQRLVYDNYPSQPNCHITHLWYLWKPYLNIILYLYGYKVFPSINNLWNPLYIFCGSDDPNPTPILHGPSGPFGPALRSASETRSAPCSSAGSKSWWPRPILEGQIMGNWKTNMWNQPESTRGDCQP